TGNDIGQRLAAFRKPTSGGTRNRARTPFQNFSSGASGVCGSGSFVSPQASRSRRCANAGAGKREADPDMARQRAKSRRDSVDMEISGKGISYAAFLGRNPPVAAGRSTLDTAFP